MKRLLIPFSIIFLTFGCTEDFTEEQFLDSDTPILVESGKEILRYDENSCQAAFNRERGEFRIMKDNLSDFYAVRLENLAFKTGDEVWGSVCWSEPYNIQEKKDIAFKVVKLEGDMIWLKSDKERIQLVLRTLE